MKTKTENKASYCCEKLSVNGVYYHVNKCPGGWRDREVKCQLCGIGFIPEFRMQGFCSDGCFEENDRRSEKLILPNERRSNNHES